MSRKPHMSPVALLLALGCLLAASAGGATAGTAVIGNGFVQTNGPELKLNGEKFRFAGSSNYYLMYKSRLMVDDVLQDAAASGFRVLRMWGSLDIGDPNVPATSIRGPSDGVYFQYWDPVAQAPAYNDGAERAAAPRLHHREGRRARPEARDPVREQLERLRRDGPVRPLARPQHARGAELVPRQLLHRSGDRAVVQELDRARPQPDEHDHGRQVQGRPDDHDVGARERASLPERRGVPTLRQLHDVHARQLGRPDLHVHQVGRPQPSRLGR